MEKIKFAAFGIRSLPPGEGCGGAETFAEELYTRLQQKGYEVTVYSRVKFGQKKPSIIYKALKVIYLPTFKKVGLDTFFHSFLCALHIIFFNTGKIVHIHNAGNSAVVPLLRLFGKKCYISMDGIDWNRTRWSAFAKFYLKITNRLAFFVCNRVIVDNKLVQEYYSKKYLGKIVYIPYGSNIRKISTDKILKELGLEKGKYLLFVGRFSIEKGVHYLIKAFEKVQTDLKLVLVGDDIYNKEWVEKLRSTKDPRIIFTGFLYDEGVDELMQNSYFYIQPSDVEGLSPVILRVMGLGKCVLSSDIPENRFLVEGHGHIFHKGDVDSLKEKIDYLINNDAIVKAAEADCLKFVQDNFSWESVTQQHIDVFSK
jgi:glycosyltransferase involved in cell wall biosynthesis